MNVLRILPNDIPEVWPKVSNVLNSDRMLNNWTSIEAQYNRLVNNKADLWVTDTLDSALIGATYTRQDGTKTYVVDFMASLEGSPEGWDNTIKPIEAQAKQWGCSSIQVKGRTGWQRVLKDYQTVQITLERKL